MSYTDEELMTRVWEIEEIKKTASKRCYYIASDDRKGELAKLWVSEPDHMKTASFGRNWGYYQGMDAIREYYQDTHQKRLEEQKTKFGQTKINVGNMYAHPVTTGVVELAGDGKTAKGIWYVIGQETLRTAEDEADARWILEKEAIDFIKEDGKWKIWHLVICGDLSSEAGTDYSDQPVYLDWDTDPMQREFGHPPIEELTHDVVFNWWDQYPPVPQPYETFSDDISYGPEGFHPPVHKGYSAKEGKTYK